MGSDSIAHEAAKAREIIIFFSKIQLVGQKYGDETTLASKTRFSSHCLNFKASDFVTSGLQHIAWW